MMKRFDMRLSLAVCFAVMMMWGAVARADTVIGIGLRSCGQFIASIDKIPPGMNKKMPTRDGGLFSENTQYQQWLMGFLSGFNSAVSAYNAALASEHEQMQAVIGIDPNEHKQMQGVTGTDLAGMDLWMRNWCNKHPTKIVYEGAVAFIDEMRRDAAAGQR